MAKRLHPIVYDDSGAVVSLVCTRCEESKAPSEFHKKTGASAPKHGFAMPCKACQRGARAARQLEYRKRHPERVKASQTEWLAKHPDYERERGKRRYQADPAYRERGAKAAREWAKAHPEYYRAAAKLRRARLSGVVCDLTDQETRELFEEYAGLCAYCHAAATTIDHVMPISAGGSHSKANLVPACKSCNSSKHDKPLLVWLATRIRKAA